LASAKLSSIAQRLPVEHARLRLAHTLPNQRQNALELSE
jgi:hypothetical protein